MKLSQRARICREPRLFLAIFAFFLVGAPFLHGCASKQKVVSLAAPTISYKASDYKSVLRDWTRSRRLNTLDEMDNVLTVTSTYYSAEFRAAYLAKYQDDYHLTRAESEAMRSEYEQLGERQHEFYVALFAQNHKYGLLDNETSAWQVHLIDDQGRAFKPTRIEYIRRPGAQELSYFPYTNSFRSVFRVIFDKSGPEAVQLPARAKWFGLRFSGPQGTTIVRWDLG